MLLSAFFGTQKGDNFRVMDRVFIGPFDITAVSQYLWAQVSGRVRAMNWLQALYFFLLPSSRASRKLPRLPVPVL